MWFNSLAPGKFEWNFRYLIFQIISVIDGRVISCELALRWMSLDLTDDKSILVQVMAWCRQATSHYLSQCWPRSLSPYGVTSRVPTKISEKSSLIFPWLLQAKIQISRQKNTNICFCGPCINLYNQLQTDTDAHSHTQTHMISSRPTDYSTDFTNF